MTIKSGIRYFCEKIYDFEYLDINKEYMFYSLMCERDYENENGGENE